MFNARQDAGTGVHFKEGGREETSDEGKRGKTETRAGRDRELCQLANLAKKKRVVCSQTGCSDRTPRNHKRRKRGKPLNGRRLIRKKTIEVSRKKSAVYTSLSFIARARRIGEGKGLSKLGVRRKRIRIGEGG